MKRRIRLSLDEALLALLDRAARQQGVNRSMFTRNALRAALTCLYERELERCHREGYLKKPVFLDEFPPPLERMDAWE